MKISKPQLPSFVWILLVVFGLITLIGGIILFFLALSTIEGFGSLIILICILLYIFTVNPNGIDEKLDGFVIAIGILFFALMASVIDQTGNIIYNKPIEILFCEQGTTLNRYTDVTHPLPGRTDMTQDFSCVDREGDVVRSISPFTVFGVRFVEYILIGYIVRYARVVVKKFKQGMTKNNI